MKPMTIRMPGRVYFYITGTGWYQGQYDDEDWQSKAMIELIDASRTNADSSKSLLVAEEWQLDFLAKEAGYALDAASWGDNTMDDLADQNAAKALIRRVNVAREAAAG